MPVVAAAQIPANLARKLHTMPRLVNTALLAAVGGLPYTLAKVLKLQGYLAYVQPMPMMLAAFGHFPASARGVTLLQGLVESAMLAEVGGAPYTLATVLKLKGARSCSSCQHW